jgi:hypothetical protein
MLTTGPCSSSEASESWLDSTLGSMSRALNPGTQARNPRIDPNHESPGRPDEAVTFPADDAANIPVTVRLNPILERDKLLTTIAIVTDVVAGDPTQAGDQDVRGWVDRSVSGATRGRVRLVQHVARERLSHHHRGRRR